VHIALQGNVSQKATDMGQHMQRYLQWHPTHVKATSPNPSHAGR